MNKPTDKRATVLIWSVLFIFTLWMAVLMASSWQDGNSIFEYMDKISSINNPFDLTLNEHTISFVVLFACIYGICVSAYYSSNSKKRYGEEHGSAVWGNPKAVNKRFSQNKKTDILLTQNVSIGLNSYKHRRNLNVLVVGGSGAGKSRFYVRPNIMQLNTSFVVTDPKSGATRF